MTRLDLVLGPNGCGKSTFIAKTLAPKLPHSLAVNADEIAKARWPADAEAKSYEAAQIAAATRAALIDARRSFVAETVFSHPSKLELIHSARQAGFRIFVHAIIVPEDIAVQRVRSRVFAGGHSVPEDKIRERYHRLWPLVAKAITLSDEATVYDTTQQPAPKIVAEFTGGTLVGAARWPAWTPAEISALG